MLALGGKESIVVILEGLNGNNVLCEVQEESRSSPRAEDTQRQAKHAHSDLPEMQDKDVPVYKVVATITA